MALKIYAAPEVEPVSLTEAKLHLRVDITDDDALITMLIQSARETVEAITRRALISQTWDMTLDDWPESDAIEVPLPPLQSVTSITYVDEDGNSATVSASDYSVDTTSDPGRIVLDADASWPSVSLRPANGVTVRFVAGYGAAGSDVPAAIRSAILLLVGHLYENREATSQNIFQLPMGVDMLLWPFRVITF